MCRKIFKHVWSFCWGLGMAGALNSNFLQLKKSSKQKLQRHPTRQKAVCGGPHYSTPDIQRQVWPACALAIGAAQGEGFLKQKNFPTNQNCNYKEERQKQVLTIERFPSPSFVRKLIEPYLLPKGAPVWLGFSAFLHVAPRERNKKPFGGGFFQNFMKSMFSNYVNQKTEA